LPVISCCGRTPSPPSAPAFPQSSATCRFSLSPCWPGRCCENVRSAHSCWRSRRCFSAWRSSEGLSLRDLRRPPGAGRGLRDRYIDPLRRPFILILRNASRHRQRVRLQARSAWCARSTRRHSERRLGRPCFPHLWQLPRRPPVWAASAGSPSSPSPRKVVGWCSSRRPCASPRGLTSALLSFNRSEHSPSGAVISGRTRLQTSSPASGLILLGVIIATCRTPVLKSMTRPGGHSHLLTSSLKPSHRPAAPFHDFAARSTMTT